MSVLGLVGANDQNFDKSHARALCGSAPSLACDAQWIDAIGHHGLPEAQVLLCDRVADVVAGLTDRHLLG